MIESPGDSRHEPSEFDADAFLARLNHDRETTAVEEVCEEAEEKFYEQQVMDALELAGMPLDVLHTIHDVLGPGRSLVHSLARLPQLIHEYRLTGETELADKLDASFIIGAWVGKAASNKHLSELKFWGEGQEHYKQQEQASLYANESFTPEARAILLEAIDTIYPDAKGLDTSDPSTLLQIESMNTEEEQIKEISDKASLLRDTAYGSAHTFLAEQRIGLHDSLESLINTLIVASTRNFVVRTGTFNDLVKESCLLAEGMTFNRAKHQALTMGWTEEQYNALVSRIERDLQKTTEE